MDDSYVSKCESIATTIRAALDDCLNSYGFVFQSKEKYDKYFYVREVDGVIQKFKLGISPSSLARPNCWASLLPEVIVAAPELDHLFTSWAQSSTKGKPVAAFAQRYAGKINQKGGNLWYIPQEGDVHLVASDLLNLVKEDIIPLLDNLSSLSKIAVSDDLVNFPTNGSALRAAAAYHLENNIKFRAAKTVLSVDDQRIYPGILNAILLPAE